MRAQPSGGGVHALDLPALDALEHGGPALHLSVVEAVRLAEVVQAARPPVDLRQEGDSFDELIGEFSLGLRVAAERFRPRLLVLHGRPAVHVTHQVEGATENSGVAADRDARCMRNIGAPKRLDDAPFAQDALVAVGWRGGGRNTEHAAVVTAVDGIDLVLRTTGELFDSNGCAGAGESGVVHPGGEPGEVDRGGGQVGHRVSTSASRKSAYRATAASRLRGSHSLGQMSSAGR